MRDKYDLLLAKAMAIVCVAMFITFIALVVVVPR